MPTTGYGLLGDRTLADMRDSTRFSPIERIGSIVSRHPVFYVVLFALVCNIGTAFAQATAQSDPPAPPFSDSLRARQLAHADSVLLASVDTLRKQLELHRFAENFIDSALEEQANRFALIIGALLTFFGILTYQGFRYEVRRLESEMNDRILEQKRTIEAAGNRMAKAEMRLLGTSGNVHRAIAELYANRERVAVAFVHSLTAAGLFCETFKSAPDPTDPNAISAHRAALANLRKSVSYIRRIDDRQRSRARSTFQKRDEVIRRAFERLHSLNDPAMLEIAAEIRLILRAFREASPDVVPERRRE